MLKDQKFIGMANYQALLNDKIFWEVLGNTGQFMLITVVINVVLALMVATGLKARLFRQRFPARALLCARHSLRVGAGHHRHPRVGHTDWALSTTL